MHVQIYIYVYLCGSAFLITENRGKYEHWHTKQSRIVRLYSSEPGMEIVLL